MVRERYMFPGLGRFPKRGEREEATRHYDKTYDLTKESGRMVRNYTTIVNRHASVWKEGTKNPFLYRGKSYILERDVHHLRDARFNRTSVFTEKLYIRDCKYPHRIFTSPTAWCKYLSWDEDYKQKCAPNQGWKDIDVVLKESVEDGFFNVIDIPRRVAYGHIYVPKPMRDSDPPNPMGPLKPCWKDSDIKRYRLIIDQSSAIIREIEHGPQSSGPDFGFVNGDNSQGLSQIQSSEDVNNRNSQRVDAQHPPLNILKSVVSSVTGQKRLRYAENDNRLDVGNVTEERQNGSNQNIRERPAKRPRVMSDLAKRISHKRLTTLEIFDIVSGGNWDTKCPACDHNMIDRDNIDELRERAHVIASSRLDKAIKDNLLRKEDKYLYEHVIMVCRNCNPSGHSGAVHMFDQPMFKRKKSSVLNVSAILYLIHLKETDKEHWDYFKNKLGHWDQLTDWNDDTKKDMYKFIMRRVVRPNIADLNCISADHVDKILKIYVDPKWEERDEEQRNACEVYAEAGTTCSNAEAHYETMCIEANDIKEKIDKVNGWLRKVESYKTKLPEMELQYNSLKMEIDDFARNYEALERNLREKEEIMKNTVKRVDKENKRFF